MLISDPQIPRSPESHNEANQNEECKDGKKHTLKINNNNFKKVGDI